MPLNERTEVFQFGWRHINWPRDLNCGPFRGTLDQAWSVPNDNTSLNDNRSIRREKRSTQFELTLQFQTHFALLFHLQKRKEIDSEEKIRIDEQSEWHGMLYTLLGTWPRLRASSWAARNNCRTNPVAKSISSSSFFKLLSRSKRSHVGSWSNGCWSSSSLPTCSTVTNYDKHQVAQR